MNDDWPIVHQYTRAQAVEDGEQILLEGDLAQLAREAGWIIPVYFTRSLWEVVQATVSSEEDVNDLTGVLWDILALGATAARANKSVDMIRFIVAFRQGGESVTFTIFVQVGPTDIDNPAPAVTFMLREDL